VNKIKFLLIAFAKTSICLMHDHCYLCGICDATKGIVKGVNMGYYLLHGGAVIVFKGFREEIFKM
jgi:hypothetical protein